MAKTTDGDSVETPIPWDDEGEAPLDPAEVEHDPWCECNPCLDAYPRSVLWLPNREIVQRTVAPIEGEG